MNIQELYVAPQYKIIDVIKKIDETARKILLVVDQDRLAGVVTDGDIRRWILKNGDLQMCVSEIMNRNPICLTIENESKAPAIMKKKVIEAIPIVDENNKILKVIFWSDIYGKLIGEDIKLNIPIVIMAGGKGTRLYPYTQILPKPLIPIGDTSIIERIIQKFKEFYCENFYITVNYKKNMIKAYFEELPKDYSVHFIEEEKFLGTGGSLYLLKDILTSTFFVSNCDILIEANYADILKYHRRQKNKITMVTSLKNYVIPYGVIQHNDKGLITSIIEKPEQNYEINTGLYVLEPETLKDIPENKFYHITDLINKYIEQGERVGAYPITENAWLDMGEIKEMERMIDKLGL